MTPKITSEEAFIVRTLSFRWFICSANAAYWLLAITAPRVFIIGRIDVLQHYYFWGCTLRVDRYRIFIKWHAIVSRGNCRWSGTKKNEKCAVLLMWHNFSTVLNACTLSWTVKSKTKAYSPKSILHQIYRLGFYLMSALTKSDAKEHETSMSR